MKSLYPYLAVPRAAMAMRSRFGFLFFFLLTASRLAALDYYWVNGNGKWSEFSTHWAKIPVPLAPADFYTNVPGAADDVYFTNNGGVAYTLDVDASVTIPKCHNMDWSAVPAGTVWGGFGSKLEIYGSTTLSANMTIAFNGYVNMIAFGGMSHIASHGVHFPVEVGFYGTAGGWNFVDDFYCDGRVNHEGGLIETNGHTVTIGSTFFGNYYNSAGELHLGSSEFNLIGGSGYFRYNATQFDAGTSHIKVHTGYSIEGPVYLSSPIRFYDVSFLAANGAFVWGNIDGTLTFHQYGGIHSYGYTVPELNNVVFLEDGLIYNANDYHNLTLTAGKTYTINGDYSYWGPLDQTILPGGSLTALGSGTCTEFITIKSWQYGTHFNLVNNSGAQQTVHCVILEDCHATGSDLLEVLDGVDLGNNTGWIFTAPNPGLDLYWVGGAGDWNDPCHWTDDPLSLVGDCGCLPNGGSNVHFTANSGFSLGDQVLIPEDAYCKNMDWAGVTGEPEFYHIYDNNLSLHIYDTLTLAEDMDFNFGGVLRFRTSNTSTITSAGQDFDYIVVFEGTGTWELQDTFKVPNYVVIHERGTLKTLGHPMMINYWLGNWLEVANGTLANMGAELFLGEPGGNSSNVFLIKSPYTNGKGHFRCFYETGKFHAAQSHFIGLNGGYIDCYSTIYHDFWNVTFNPIDHAGDFLYGNILNKLTFLAFGNLVGPNTHLHEAQFNAGGYIYDSHSYDILTLSGGNIYKFQHNNTVQTITAGGLFQVINGSCTDPTYLFNPGPGQTTTFRKEGAGTMFNISHTIFDRVYADQTTGAIYNATNCNGVQQDVEGSWNIANPPARDLYWVGGDGNWSDSGHWAITSGGAGGECLPTSHDNVFFDGGSGLSAGDAVTVDVRFALCKDMDWTGVGNGTIFKQQSPLGEFFGGNHLQIFGSLTFSANMDNQFGGPTWLRANGPATITSAGQTFKNDLMFWDDDGQWSLQDDLSTSVPTNIVICHYYGELITNNHNITTGGWNYSYVLPNYGFGTGPTASAQISLGSSKLKVWAYPAYNSQAFFYGYGAGKFDAGTSEIIMEATGPADLIYAGGYAGYAQQVFYDITIKGTGGLIGGEVSNKLLINGTGYVYAGGPIKELEFKGDGYFYPYYTYSRDVHSIKFAPGKRYTFQAPFTLNLVPHNGQEAQFIAQGLPGQYIEIKSTDFNTPAIIHKDDYDGTSTCTKYLFLTGMDHTGTEDIYVPTPGGDVFNNDGWLFFPCNPCPASIPELDAQSITVGCAPGRATLILANLKPDEWANWYTDPGAMTNLVYSGGNLFQPLITGPITYYARVYSDGGLCESTVILAVNITITTPPPAYTVFGGGQVCAGSSGVPIGLDDSDTNVSYQLQLNGADIGSPVVGTGAAITFGNQTAPGTYTVWGTTIGTGCPGQMNGSALITGNPNQAPVVLAGSNAPLCVGAGPLYLTESGGELISWSWTGPNGFGSTDQNPSIASPMPAESGNYTVSGIGANGCANSQTISVAINPLPDGTITTDLNVCSGSIGNTASVPDAGPGATYTWSILNGTITSGLGTNVITYTAGLSGPVVLYVTVENAGGCFGTGCSNTFIQSLGDMGGSQPGIFPHPNGDFFATGLRNDSMVIVRFDPSGVPRWSRAFMFGTNTILIRDMLVEASGDLIGVAYYETGQAPDARSTAFRYNMTTHTFVWVQHISNVLFTNVIDFDADECILTGVSTTGNTQLMRISKANGTVSNYALRGEGGDYYSVLHNGHLYGACRRYYTPDTDLRASVFSHDAATGAFEWQNSIISVGDASGGPNKTRMYPEKPVIDNDSIVVLASGDLVGFNVYNSGPTELVVAKTNLTGDVSWTKQYIMAGYNQPQATRIANTADGYYIVGNLWLPSLNNFGFGILLKVDKQGNLLWAKRLGISGKNIVKNIMERGGFLHLTMSSDSYAPNELLLLKLDQLGNSSDGCDFIQPLTVSVVNLQNIQNVRNYTTSNTVNNLTSLNVLSYQTPTDRESRCGTPCTNSVTINTGNAAPEPVEPVLPDLAVCGSIVLIAPAAINPCDPNAPLIYGTPSIPAIPLGTTPPSYLVEQPGTYIITWTYNNNGQISTQIQNLVVNPIPDINGIPFQQLCNGEPTNPIVFTNSVPGSVFEWTNSNTAIGLAASGTGNIPSFTATNTGTSAIFGSLKAHASYTNGGLTCVSQDTTGGITVYPTPTVDQQQDILDCHGSFVSILLTGTVPFTQFDWTNDNPSIGFPANYSGDFWSNQLSNNTGTIQIAHLTVTPFVDNNGVICYGDTKYFTITVLPYPQVDPVPDQSVCHNELSSPVIFTGPVSGTTFTWTNNNTAIGLGPNGTGNIPAFIGQNNTNAPVQATIRVSASYTYNNLTCVDSLGVRSFKMIVNPLPAEFDLSGQTLYCAQNDGGAPMQLSGSQIGVSYQVHRNGLPVGAPVPGTGAPIVFGPQVASTYTVVAIHNTGGCTRTMNGSLVIQSMDCTIEIVDPCSCKNNATTLLNGQFDERIKVYAPSWQTWTVKAVSGLYRSNSPAPPAAPLPVVTGSAFNALGGNMFDLDGVLVDAIGYTITATNGSTDLVIPLRACYYPNPTLLDVGGPYCLNTNEITLAAKVENNPAATAANFNVNGTNLPATFNVGTGNWEAIYDISTFGSFQVNFTFDAGAPTANNPADPGCIQKTASQFFHVIETPAVLNCNDLIHISLDTDCNGEILPDQVLDGSYGCFDDYLVEIDRTLPYGNGPWEPALLNSDDIGKTYVYRVIHLPSGNYCWGNVKVEDKLPPALFCENFEVPCNLPDFSPNYLFNTWAIVPAIPVATDCQTINWSYIDTETPQNCASGLTSIINRKWTATDASGNTATCEQLISLTRPTLSDVSPPPDYDGFDAPVFTCEDNIPIVNGHPLPTPQWIDDQGLQGYPYAFGLPGSCTINWAWEDYPIDVCDGTIKYRREWTIADWCTGELVVYNQIIKVTDEQGPSMPCPANLSVSTDPFNCCATVNLPDVIIEDNCSRINNISGMVTIREQYTNEVIGMSTFGGTLTDFAGNNYWSLDTLAAFGWTTCLTIGNHSVTYVATDDCGNSSVCEFQLTVYDNVPPVAACDETTIVGIGPDDSFDCYEPSDACEGAGVTWVQAATFDDGSYDICNHVKFTVRRMAPYSDCINNLSKEPCYPGDLSEFDIATAEADSIKFYCCEVGTTQTVILRVYQVDLEGNFVLGADGEPLFNECMVQVQVQDKIKPFCAPPANVTVTCEQFDPSLWVYGKADVLDNCCLDETKVYQGQCGLTHSVSYTNFDTLCNKGTIVRTFRAFDCHGQSSQCTQRIVVNYEQDYYVRFPNDVIVSVCDGTGDYGAPTFFGEDCEMLGVSYEDEIFTVVPDACFKIERHWKIINWCTFNPNGACINVPNPNPNATTNHPTNLPGPIVSPIQTVGDPWKSTIMKINPTDAATNYSIYYDPNANCYTYSQIIKIIDTQDPIVECPASPVTVCDVTPNDVQLWNETYWWDNANQSHDLCEAPSDICITATDACSGSNINFEYQLFLDLDGDGIMETVVNSTQLGNQAGGLGWNNVLYGNVLGAGEPRSYDGRPVPTNQKWGFAIQETVTGNNKTACVKFNTCQQQNTYVTPQLPHGTHKIKWFVSDGCGNETVCEYTIIVKDCKAPTVVCLNGLSVNIMPTGMITMWASDFLQYAEDNCTQTPWLKYGIRKCGQGTGFPVDANGNPITQVNFTCDELGTQCVELWAIDLAGNADYCETYVIVQDNAGNCPDGNINVSGALKTEMTDGVEEAEVQITGSVNFAPPFNYFDMTNDLGTYEVLNSVPVASTMTITPVKDDNPLNGLTTYDLVLIQKHILGIDPLDSPYKMIAADANKSNSITTFDIVELRKLILGMYTELPNNTSWRFVDKAQVFTNPNNPFMDQIRENISIPVAMTNQLNQDFVGVKIGDVNNTAVANSAMQADDRTTGVAIFDLEDRDLRKGDEFEVTFTSVQELKGFQFTLSLNGLTAIGTVDTAHVTQHNFNLLPVNAMAVSIDGAQGFTVRFRADQAGKLSQMLGLSGSITRAEAYGHEGRMGVALRFGGKTITGVGFELYQNQPNPFVNKTFIGFHLPEAAAATLTVYDETGRVVYQHKGYFGKGENTISLDRALLNTVGLLYYKLETATDSATKKMIQAK